MCGGVSLVLQCPGPPPPAHQRAEAKRTAVESHCAVPLSGKPRGVYLVAFPAHGGPEEVKLARKGNREIPVGPPCSTLLLARRARSLSALSGCARPHSFTHSHSPPLRLILRLFLFFCLQPVLPAEGRRFVSRSGSYTSTAGASPGTQSQHTSSYKTPRLVS